MVRQDDEEFDDELESGEEEFALNVACCCWYESIWEDDDDVDDAADDAVAPVEDVGICTIVFIVSQSLESSIPLFILSRSFVRLRKLYFFFIIYLLFD